MDNLIQQIDNDRVSKTLTTCLSSYTQANCQVSVTDKGYRIYRPANVIYDSTDNTKTMWGGLKLRMFDIASTILQKGHTYIFLMEIEGQTSQRPTSLGWTNQMGWGGGGLSPSPSNVEYYNISADFNGKQTYFYKWTINDDLFKVCTTSYSSFVAGTTYLSYRDFMFGFTYENTGSLGTDLYLTNFRMYDITNNKNYVNFLKTGIVDAEAMIETDRSKFEVHNIGDLLINELVEY